MRCRGDHHHFEFRTLAQPVGDRLRDLDHGVVLVLDVDVAFGLSDHVEEQGLDLPHLFLILISRLGAGDADLDIAEIRLDMFGPAIAAGARLGEMFAGRTFPAGARQRAERVRGIAFDDGLHVMERPVGLAVTIPPQRLVEVVRAGVPAPDRDVEAAGERDAVIHHDQLLMLRRADRHRVVEGETDAGWRAPLQRHDGEHFPLAGVERGEVPQQDIDLQLGPLARQGGQKFAELLRIAVIGSAAFTEERRPAVNVPAEDEDLRSRLEHRGARRAEIGRSVDEHGSTARVLPPPDRMVRARQHPGRKSDGT